LLDAQAQATGKSAIELSDLVVASLTSPVAEGAAEHLARRQGSERLGQYLIRNGLFTAVRACLMNGKSYPPTDEQGELNPRQRAEATGPMLIALVPILQLLSARSSSSDAVASAAAGVVCQEALGAFVAVILSAPLLTLVVPRAMLRLVCSPSLWGALLESFQVKSPALSECETASIYENDKCSNECWLLGNLVW
jgi:hypothetical protein